VLNGADFYRRNVIDGSVSVSGDINDAHMLCSTLLNPAASPQG
jgi:hypothetical protein